MKNPNVRKAPGPDTTSEWVLTECREQLPDKIKTLIQHPIKEAKVPFDWKCINIKERKQKGADEFQTSVTD